MAGTKCFKANILRGTNEASEPIASKYHSSSLAPVQVNKQSKHPRHHSKAGVFLEIIKENCIEAPQDRGEMPQVIETVRLEKLVKRPRPKSRGSRPKSSSMPRINRRSALTKSDIFEYEPRNMRKGAGEKPLKKQTENQGSKIQPLWCHFGLDKEPLKIEDGFDSKLRKARLLNANNSKHAIPAIHAPSKKKEEFVQHVFVINGSAMAFRQASTNGFVNWFKDESELVGSGSVHEFDEILNKFDFSGFSNQEISLKLYGGNKLIIEATRPCRGKFPPKSVQHKIVLPKGMHVDSLRLSRNENGDVIMRKVAEIEEL